VEACHKKDNTQTMKSPIAIAVACAIIYFSPAVASADAAPDGVALAKAKNCSSCHAADHKVVGPAFQDIAARYRGDKTAPARLANKVVNGGGGVWGVLKMPANRQVNDAEAQQLVAWILSQPAPAAAPK
jgi:cytochrome c